MNIATRHWKWSLLIALVLALLASGTASGGVNSDGDLDAFVANYIQANKVWLNDGSGAFTDSAQSLGISWSLSVALGDVDSDGDLDLEDYALVQECVYGYAQKDGAPDGGFEPKGGPDSIAPAGCVFADMDNDGDVDLKDLAAFQNAYTGDEQ